MRIGELSRRSGLPVPTIKFYIREGLLPPGRPIGPKQADYDESHERQLRLVVALLEVGRLSVATIRALLDAVGTGEHAISLPEVLDVVNSSLSSSRRVEDNEHHARARELVTELIHGRGWRLNGEDSLIDVVATLERVGHGEFMQLLDNYAQAAQLVAEADLAYVTRSGRHDQIAESVLISTVLGGALFASLRRIAEVDAIRKAFGGAPSTDCSVQPHDEHDS
jgi:DNA-binding transcriptional MerR regulator